MRTLLRLVVAAAGGYFGLLLWSDASTYALSKHAPGLADGCYTLLDNLLSAMSPVQFYRDLEEVVGAGLIVIALLVLAAPWLRAVVAMRALLTVVLVAGLAGCDRRSEATLDRDSALVEAVAVNAMLAGKSIRGIRVDSMFAEGEQAPPSMTRIARSIERQRALLAAVESIPRIAGGDSVHVRASRPTFSGDEASISVTIDEFLAARANRMYYETVVFTLVMQDRRWVVQRRVHLGQS